MIRYVVGFMFNNEKTQVALIKKTKPDWQKGLYNGIGGKKEPGESSIDAMVREFEEETGQPTFPYMWNHLIRAVDYNRSYAIEFYYTFAHDTYLSNLKTVTEEEVVILNLAELDTLPVVPNLRWLIRLCLDNTVYAAAIVF